MDREEAGEPGYIGLYRSGELQRRVEAMESRLARCDICPRTCGVNRLADERGFCRSGYLPPVSALCDHHGEEPAISGTRGTGAVFFANCTMSCVYCQNHQISQNADSDIVAEMGFHELARRIVSLQDDLGCHNISFISPSHLIPQLLRTVLEAVPMGLSVPLVYNSSGYDSVSALQALDGVIDVYLPDLRYASDTHAARFSGTPDYVTHARPAILEMHRQAGRLTLDMAGMARKGLIVRHLILPNGLAGTRDSLTWLKRELSPTVTLSIMSQYYPAHLAPQTPGLGRRISTEEYEAVVDLLDELGLESGWIQDMDAADNYLPDFTRPAHPFSPGVPER